MLIKKKTTVEGTYFKLSCTSRGYTHFYLPYIVVCRNSQPYVGFYPDPISLVRTSKVKSPSSLIPPPRSRASSSIKWYDPPPPPSFDSSSRLI